MTSIGYALSSEEHPARNLVGHAIAAEHAGFEFALISDHYHPWTDRQGNSPFAWSVLGGIAVKTSRLRVGTGVTCPTVRYHPAIVAQAAATAAELFDGRFFLGVGTGENLNEHVVGAGWPRYETRREMLVEAVDILRQLWTGEMVSYDGDYHVVDNARIYSLPDEAPEVYVAASGPESALTAGQIGDGLVATLPDAELLETFDRGGGTGKPRYGQLSVCWAPTREQALEVARDWWPVSAVPGDLHQELPLPAHFEQASSLVTADAIERTVVCGPDPEEHLARIREYEAAGFDHVYVHQVGPDQEGFFRFYADRVLPRLG